MGVSVSLYSYAFLFYIITTVILLRHCFLGQYFVSLVDFLISRMSKVDFFLDYAILEEQKNSKDNQLLPTLFLYFSLIFFHTLKHDIKHN